MTMESRSRSLLVPKIAGHEISPVFLEVLGSLMDRGCPLLSPRVPLRFSTARWVASGTCTPQTGQSWRPNSPITDLRLLGEFCNARILIDNNIEEWPK
jgi:hypothetical protein